MADRDSNYVFISYAHKDSDDVFPIIKALKDAGISLWYDDGIEAGTEWPKYIGKKLSECTKMIIMLTDNYIASQNCTRELNMAVSKRKPILTLHLQKNIELPEDYELQLGTSQGMFRHNFECREDFLEELILARFFEDCTTDEYSKYISRIRAKREDDDKLRREIEEKVRREIEEETRRKLEEEIRREAEKKARRKIEKRAKKEVRKETLDKSRLLWISFIILSISAIVANIAVAIFAQSAFPWVIGATIGAVYAALFMILKHLGKSCNDIPCLIVGILLAIAIIPLLCVSNETRKCAFAMSVGLFAASIHSLVYNLITKKFEDSLVHILFGISGCLFFIALSLCFLSEWPKYLTIGISLTIIILLMALFDLLIGGYGIALCGVVLLSLTGIAFWFVSREFTVLSMFAFFTAAICLGLLIFGNEDDVYLFHVLWYIIPLGISFIVLFTHYGYTDYVIKDNAFVAYYGQEEVLVIPDGIEVICANAIHGKAKKSIRRVVIPDSVIVIGEDAFLDCVKLDTVEISNNSKLKTIECWAFGRCNLYDVCLPDSLSFIYSSAFAENRMENVYLGENIKSIGGSAFLHCSLTSIYYGGSSEQWDTIDKKMGDSWIYSNKQWDSGNYDYQMHFNVSRDDFLNEFPHNSGQITNTPARNKGCSSAIPCGGMISTIIVGAWFSLKKRKGVIENEKMYKLSQ